MAYSKQSWADGSSGGTPLSAARLQHMEDGIAAAVTVDGGGAAVGQVPAVFDVSPLTFGLVKDAVRPEQYGAVGDGVADDTAAVQAAIADGEARGIDVILTGRYKMTGGITWDPSAHSIAGAGDAALDFTGLASGFAIRISSTHTGANRYRQIRSALRGIEILGPTADATTVDCFWLDGTGTNNPFFTIARCKIDGFRDQLYIKDNTWCWVFFRCNFGGAKRRAVFYDADNFAGENFTFISCIFHDAQNTAGTAVAIYAPWKFVEVNMNFWACSFDYNNLEFEIGSGTFNLMACHIEDENTGPMVRTSAGTTPNTAETVFNMYGGRIYIRNAAPERAYLHEHTAGSRARIIYNGVRLNANARQYDVVRALADEPLVRVVDCYIPKSSTDSTKQVLPGNRSNKIYNGGFELGNTNSWTSPTSSIGTVTVQTADVRSGTYALQFVGSGVAGQRSFEQRFPIEPGQAVVARTSVKVTGMTGGTLNLYLRAYASDGYSVNPPPTSLASDQFAITADREWGEVYRWWTPPAGTAWIAYRLSFDNVNGTVLIDDCYLALV